MDDCARRFGFQRSRAASTTCYHPKTHVRVVVHGDHFAFAAMNGVGVLGRSSRWTEEGLVHEASDKHCQALLEGLGLCEESKTVNSAAVNPEDIGQEGSANVLDEAERKKFRSLEATLNHMILDRSDVQYAAKNICAKMANPTRGSWKRLKKAARCLTGVESVRWAKGPKRRSTSGAMISPEHKPRALSMAEADMLRGHHRDS